MNTTQQNYEAMLAEIAHWRAVAVYLADCHAATAMHDGLMAKTGKSSRKRFASICQRAADLLEQKSQCGAVNAERVVERCREAAKELGAQ